MKPEQFWRLHPRESGWLVDARRPKKTYGSLSEQEVAELHEDLKQRGLIDGGD